MGDSKKWGDGFAAWLTALPTGIKFVVALGLALSTIVPAGLIVSVVAPLIWEQPERHPEGTVKILCEEGASHIYVRIDDPRWEPDGLSNAELDRMCELEQAEPRGS